MKLLHLQSLNEISFRFRTVEKDLNSLIKETADLRAKIAKVSKSAGKVDAPNQSMKGFNLALEAMDDAIRNGLGRALRNLR